MSLNQLRLLLAACIFLPSSIFSQSAAITIDEEYDDWPATLATFTDGVDNPGGIDLLDFQVTNDADWLFVKITLDTEIDITDNIIPHTTWLYLDTDDNPSTGFLAQTGYGTELGVNFRQHYAWFDIPEPDIQVDFADFKLRILPTVSSTTFELAIARDAVPDGINPLFPGNTIRVLVKETNDGDTMPDVGTIFQYTFDETPVPAYDPIDITKSDPSLLRIVAYNTLGNGLNAAARVDNFESIITALSPDIIGFSESSGTSTGTVKALLDTWLPLGTIDGWYVIKDDYDLITASKWPFLGNWNLDRQFPVLIDLPALYVSDILFTNSHLNCCAADGTRQDQADEYASFILDAKSAGGLIDLPANTPFVYAGDLNLVGFAQQLTTLITGDIQDPGTYGPGAALDWDGTDLKDQKCIQSDKRMAYTWRDDGNAYPPGRLDFQIFSDAVITASKSFTLQTEVMPLDRLALYGLNSFDTGDASDHFPVTVDYAFTPMIDSDGDGIQDGSDNCPDDPNTNQADWNNDGIGDVCQDSDLDGLLDSEEILLYNTDPGDNDTDDDDVLDGDEVLLYFTNPLIQDTDGDGLTDALEINVSGTSPLLPDTDGDGCEDDLEFSLQCPDSVCNPCPVDLNGDSIIGTADLLILLASFGQPCN
jgi:hypothetical protein